MAVHSRAMENPDYEKAATGLREVGQSSRSKYLVFSLAEKQYGISLSKVKEVIGLTEITPIPHVPSFFKGLINLRGKIISVIDLRVKLALHAAPHQPKKTSIIITEIGDLTIGAVVDDVDEVVGFRGDQIEENLDIASNIKREFITSVAKSEDKKLVLLLDVERIFSAEEIGLLTKKASTHSE